MLHINYIFFVNFYILLQNVGTPHHSNSTCEQLSARMNVTGNYSYHGQPVMLHEQQTSSRTIREQYKQIIYLENLGTETNIWAYDGGTNKRLQETA
jgi:hypothetical protein